MQLGASGGAGLRAPLDEARDLLEVDQLDVALRIHDDILRVEGAKDEVPCVQVEECCGDARGVEL
jgi:hypothetical protein